MGMIHIQKDDLNNNMDFISLEYKPDEAEQAPSVILDKTGYLSAIGAKIVCVQFPEKRRYDVKDYDLIAPLPNDDNTLTVFRDGEMFHIEPIATNP